MNNPLRAGAKRIAERALRALVAPGRLRRLRGRSLVLAYHNVVPDGWRGGDRSLHLPHAAFAAQLHTLAATHEVVPLTTLLDPAGGAPSRPRVAITFDDAYRGVTSLALPTLARHGFPATVFVSPAFLDGGAFWWDELAQIGTGLDPVVRAYALGPLAGDDAAIRTWATQRGVSLQRAPKEARVASLEDLQSAAANAGLTIAAHSWSHPNLTRVDDGRLAVELTQPLNWLRERVASTVPLLAYPYGAFDDRVARAAAAAGYTAAFAIDGGWMPVTVEEPLALPRVNIPAGLSVDGFALRLAGLFV